MFISNHVLGGALVGVVAKRHPVLALGLGFASHFVMDSNKHWGTREGSDFMKVAKRDGLLGLSLVAGALWLSDDKVSTSLAILGAVGPDLDHPAQHFFNRTIWPEKLTQFHSRIQRNKESPHHINRELFVGVGLVGLLLASKALSGSKKY